MKFYHFITQDGLRSVLICSEFLRGEKGSEFCVTLTGSSSVSVSIEMENTQHLIETSAAKDKTQRLHSCLKVCVSAVSCVCLSVFVSACVLNEVVVERRQTHRCSAGTDAQLETPVMSHTHALLCLKLLVPNNSFTHMGLAINALIIIRMGLWVNVSLRHNAGKVDLTATWTSSILMTYLPPNLRLLNVLNSCFKSGTLEK